MPKHSSITVCKLCGESSRQIVQHYRLQHLNTRLSTIPCYFDHCNLNFNSVASLKVHVHRNHSSKTGNSNILLKCCSCENAVSFEKYFQHLHTHLKQKESVKCPYKDCNFSTDNINSFRPHKARRHIYIGNSPSAFHFKDDLLTSDSSHSSSSYPGELNTQSTDGSSQNEANSSEVNRNCIDFEDDAHEEDFVSETCDPTAYFNKLKNKVATFLIQLETNLRIPSSTVQTILLGLNDIHELSKPVILSSIKSIIDSHQLEPSLANEITDSVIQKYPFFSLTSKSSGGELATRKLRQRHVKQNFPYIDPVEIELGYREGKLRTFSYIPILSVLRNILLKPDALHEVVSGVTERRVHSAKYCDFRDGLFFSNNSLCQIEETVLLIGLYQDDFEVANPLGTSRKVHKICSFYWTLINIPHRFRSSLQVINTCILCKTTDFKYFGKEAVLRPLLRDIHTLETNGLYVDLLQAEVKGTLAFISADNLGAHTIGGFFENFSTVQHFCRFCCITLSDFLQSENPNLWVSQFRDKEVYEEQVQLLRDNTENSRRCGLKTECIIHNYLANFHVTHGLPPDVSHDLLEGIVPFEIALCIGHFINSGYFSLDYLNHRIHDFPFKGQDITNKPHEINPTFKKSHTIGGNATENRCLLKLLFLFIGSIVPEDVTVWHLLLDLKDIVELCHVPVLSETEICLLEAKINSHHLLFRKCFPLNKLKPKHHYVQHYPHLMRCFGPLVQCSTIRYEAKHSYFKNVIRSKKNFKNVCKMLAEHHQFDQANSLCERSYFKSDVCSSEPILIDLEMFSEKDQQCFTSFDCQKLFTLPKASISGVLYKPGFLVVYSVDLMPKFGKINAILMYNDVIHFFLDIMETGYNDHLQMFSVTHTGVRQVVSLED